MPTIVSSRGILGDVSTEIARLEGLLADFERVGSGRLPAQTELDQAPLLDPFTFSTRELPCLIGGNHRHPLLRGPLIRTSELVMFAPELGWARTINRLYRLGQLVTPGTGQ